MNSQKNTSLTYHLKSGLSTLQRSLKLPFEGAIFEERMFFFFLKKVKRTYSWHLKHFKNL